MASGEQNARIGVRVGWAGLLRWVLAYRGNWCPQVDPLHMMPTMGRDTNSQWAGGDWCTWTSP